MINITLILLIAAIIIVAILAFRVLKGVLKIAFSIAGILFLVLVIILAIAYIDAKNMQELLEEGDKIILYQEGETIMAGVEVSNGSLLVQGEGRLPENIKVLNTTTLQAYEEMLQEETIDENKLIFIITNYTFNNESSIAYQDIKINKKMYDEIMNSKDAKKTLAEMIVAQADLNEEESALALQKAKEETGKLTNKEIKSGLFISMLSKHIEQEGEQVILEHIKEEEIIIKPDFFIMKIINQVPDKVFEEAMGKTLNTETEEEAKA